jgi:starch synthase (maltosyl-transferring)
MVKQQRLIIENVKPQINCGHFFIKRVINEIVLISADIFSDGHDVIQAEVEVQHEIEGKHDFSTRLYHDVNDHFMFHIKGIITINLMPG